MKRVKRYVLYALLGISFALVGMNAESCQQSNEHLKTNVQKLERDQHQLEESTQKQEAEEGCEKTPPYNCPKR